MKQLLLISHTAQVGGGAEQGLYDLARHYGPRCHVLLFAEGPLIQRLEQIGVSYSVIHAGSGMFDVRRSTNPLRLFWSIPSVLSLAWRLARVARHYAVLFPNTQKAAVVTMLTQPFIRRPLVWWMHDIFSAEHFAFLQRRLMVLLANLTAREVIVVSEAARKSFLVNGGDARRAVVVFNGVDTTPFAAGNDAKTAGLRASLGLAEVPVVGLFGRIAAWKGQHVLLRALADLPGVHGLFVGDALFGEHEYRDKLYRMGAELGISDRVHWLGLRRDVPALMGAVDVVVHTSIASEPFGRVIVEGMLACRPVVATDHGASRELLGDDPQALVRPDDATALAQAVQRLLQLPPQERLRIGQRNQDRATEMFSLHTMLSGIERVVALDGAP